MWLLTPSGFVSIVEHRADPSMLLVRARVLSDLESFVAKAKLLGVRPVYELVRFTPAADYPYRVTLPRTLVATIVSDFVLRDLHYPNFKAAAPHDRQHVLHNVWSELQELTALND